MFVIPAVGFMISCVMVMPDVDVQPLAPVTVTVYIPGVVMLVAAIDSPLLHAYPTPPVAVTLIEVLEQVNSVELLLLVIPAVGAVLSIVVVTAAVEVQPLVPVTVTVYVPAVVTVIASVVAEVDHA